MDSRSEILIVEVALSSAIKYPSMNPPIVTFDTSFRVALGEMFGAFILTLGVTAAVTDKVHVAASGCVVGLSLLLGISFAAAVSNGVLNPAVAIGVALSGLGSWASIWIYLVACLRGGALAGVVFRLLTPDDA